MTDAVDPFEIPKDYYFYIRDTFNDYSKYIKQYKLVFMNFCKKLSQFQEKYGQPLLDFDKIKNKYKNIKLDYIFDIFSFVPKIAQKMSNNFNNSVNELDSIIQTMDKILAEKINNINPEKKNEDDLEFDSKKNSLLKYYKGIEKNKNIFMNKMGNVEDVIVKYYSYIYNPDLEDPEDKNHKEKDKFENSITKDQFNSSIAETKKAETLYSSSFKSEEEFEKPFNNISQKIKQKLSNYSFDLTKELKNIILETTLIIKNNFSEPLKEISFMLEKISDKKCDENFLKIINDSLNINIFVSKKTPQMYKLKLLNEPKKINNKKNANYHIITIDDGSDKLTYIEDFPTLYTINSLYENYDLIDKEYEFDFNLELSKLETIELSQKLLSYADKDPNQITDTGNIKLFKEDIKKLNKLLDDHKNRIIFLQDLTTFRAKGIHGVPKDIFDMLSELFILMCNTIARDKDYNTAKNIIILSQTYYYLKDGVKHYLQEMIQDNDIFKNYKFWEGYTLYCLEKEMIKNIQNDKKNDKIIKRTKKQSDDIYATVAFSQLISVADNMISVNFETKKIKEIVKPLIKHYNIKEESIQIIDQILYKDNFRQSILLNDEIKLLDVNKLNDYYKNFDAFENINLENPDDEINKAEKLEDIFDNPKDDEKGE